MAKMTTEEILGVFEEMSVLELKEFLDAFEEKLMSLLLHQLQLLRHLLVAEKLLVARKQKIHLMLF